MAKQRGALEYSTSPAENCCSPVSNDPLFVKDFLLPLSVFFRPNLSGGSEANKVSQSARVLGHISKSIAHPFD
jgi:hypothetical protein